MKLAILVLVFVIISVTAFFVWENRGEMKIPVNQNSSNIKAEKPLDKYTIDALSKTKFTASDIELGDVLKDDPGFVSRYFYFKVSGKRVSGQINFPKAPGTYPVIVMNRGYIDRETFKTGDGTRRSSEVFAKNGFITVAPDFLGYGQSDMPSESPLEERLQTNVTPATSPN